jgi:hypothetical protein
MFRINRLRELAIQSPLPGRPPYVSAASGLVCVGDYLYVIADDELHLAIFSRLNDSPGQLLSIVDGDLPLEATARKKQKPDFETLVRVPVCAEFPFGALLALGSGSKKSRDVLLPLDAVGAVAGAPRRFDFSAIYALLRAKIEGLNVEGAFFEGNDFCLLQRGNSKKSFNAIISFNWRELFVDFSHEKLGAINPRSVVQVDLGSIEGVALCFTDGVALPDGNILFSAVAEATDDAYLDGACMGAAIGICRCNGDVLMLQPTGAQYKIEGIDAVVENGAIELLMVTDPDNIAVAALLLGACIDDSHPADQVSPLDRR